MSTNTEKQWRVQVRKSRAHKWANKGLFETREDARNDAAVLRFTRRWTAKTGFFGIYGFGNTRVVRYEKG